MTECVILGIDPGLRVTGFGLIAVQAHRCRYLSCGVIRSRAATQAPVAERLYELFSGVSQLTQQFSPQEVAIEKVFLQNNPQSALLLGQARGVLMCAAYAAACTIFEYTALQIKSSVVGHGHAVKEQVRFMVKELLTLSLLPQTDAADALACALCHAFRHHAATAY